MRISLPRTRITTGEKTRRLTAGRIFCCQKTAPNGKGLRAEVDQVNEVDAGRKATAGDVVQIRFTCREADDQVSAFSLRQRCIQSAVRFLADR